MYFKLLIEKRGTMPYFADNYRPPSVSILPVDLEVMAGDTVKVFCNYSGEPLPVVRWLKDGQGVSSVWPDGQTVVELKNVSESFVLTCLADNRIDTASVHVFVNVTGGRRDNNGLFTVVYTLVTRLLTSQW